MRGLLDNAERTLLPGQFVKVQLNVATKSAAMFIPEQALIPQPKTQLVFKVVAGKAQMIPVETGTRLKGWVEITSEVLLQGEARGSAWADYDSDGRVDLYVQNHCPDPLQGGARLCRNHPVARHGFVDETPASLLETPGYEPKWIDIDLSLIHI